MLKKQNKIIFLLVGLFFLLGCEKKEESTGQGQAKYADMKSYIKHKCTMCHFTDRIFEKVRKPSEWKKLVRRMRNRNRQWITAEDELKILDYLITNKSTPEEKLAQDVETDDQVK